MTASFTHRPATAADKIFLQSLFLQARPELGLLPEPVRGQVLGLQFEAQRRQYLSTAPGAVDEIIEIADADRPQPAGRVWHHRTATGHRLLDLAILADLRGRGIGSAVLQWLCAEAARDGVPLNLSVWNSNTGARALYLRHGFSIVEDGNDYTELQWRAGQ